MGTLLDTLTTSFAELDSLSEVSTGVQALIDEPAPDAAAINALLDDATTDITTGQGDIDTAASQLDDISSQLAVGTAAFGEIQAQWESIGGIFDQLGPMLEGAIESVRGVSESLDVMPVDAVEQVGTFRTMVDELIDLRYKTGQDISGARDVVATMQSDIQTTRESFILWKMFHGNSTFEMPEDLYNEACREANTCFDDFVNATMECETVDCFQSAVQFLDDNLFDALANMIGWALGLEPADRPSNPLPKGRTDAFALLYTFSAIGALCAIVGASLFTCFRRISSVLRALGVCIVWPVSVFFLLMGAVLFPGMLLLSDTCDSMEHLVYNLTASDQHLVSLRTDPTVLQASAGRLAVVLF